MYLCLFRKGDLTVIVNVTALLERLYYTLLIWDKHDLSSSRTRLQFGYTLPPFILGVRSPSPPGRLP